jgi:hypothetical protein
MSRWKTILGAPLLAAGLGLGAAAFAADPSVSVPSTPDASGKVLVRGKDVAPLSNVTVRFENPQASPISMVVQSANNGSFVLSFSPPIAGAYKVTVFDSAGQLIGQGNFGVIR